MRIPIPLLAAGFAALLCCNGHADATPPPHDQATHIEFGVGLGGAHFADYPGASRYWNLLLPLPYVTLRSPRLDASRDGVRGKLFKSDKWSLTVDFGGSVPVNSTRDAERHDMPNLGWIGEAGPVLKYRAWRDARAGFQLDLSLAARFAASAQGVKLHHRGWVTEPRLALSRNWGNAGTHYHADVGVSWNYATHDYFNYVYGVSPQYADAGRPTYQAGGGYGGYAVSLGFGIKHGDMIYGAFYRYINLSGTSFSGSPLVSERHQNAFGFAIAWIFKHVDY